MFFSIFLDQRTQDIIEKSIPESDLFNSINTRWILHKKQSDEFSRVFLIIQGGAN